MAKKRTTASTKRGALAKKIKKSAAALSQPNKKKAQKAQKATPAIAKAQAASPVSGKLRSSRAPTPASTRAAAPVKARPPARPSASLAKIIAASLKPAVAAQKARKAKAATKVAKPVKHRKAQARPAAPASGTASKGKQPTSKAWQQPTAPRGRVLSQTAAAQRARARRAAERAAAATAAEIKARTSAEQRGIRDAQRQRALEERERKNAQARARRAAKGRPGKRGKRGKRGATVALREAMADWLEAMRNLAAVTAPISMDIVQDRRPMDRRETWEEAGRLWEVVARFDLSSPIGYTELAEIFQNWQDDPFLDAAIGPSRFAQIRTWFADPTDRKGYGDAPISWIGPWSAMIGDAIGELVGAGGDSASEDSLAARYEATTVRIFYVYFSASSRTYTTVFGGE